MPDPNNPASTYVIIHHDQPQSRFGSLNDIIGHKDLHLSLAESKEIENDGLDQSEIFHRDYLAGLELLDFVVEIATSSQLRNNQSVLVLIPRRRFIKAGIEQEQFLDFLALCQMQYTYYVNSRRVEWWRTYYDPTWYITGIDFIFETREEYNARIDEYADVLRLPKLGPNELR